MAEERAGAQRRDLDLEAADLGGEGALLLIVCVGSQFPHWQTDTVFPSPAFQQERRTFKKHGAQVRFPKAEESRGVGGGPGVSAAAQMGSAATGWGWAQASGLLEGSGYVVRCF